MDFLVSSKTFLSWFDMLSDHVDLLAHSSPRGHTRQPSLLLRNPRKKLPRSFFFVTFFVFFFYYFFVFFFLTFNFVNRIFCEVVPSHIFGKNAITWQALIP